jgi:hypothetical protein
LWDFWPFARDVILFFAGLAGIAHQTLVAPTPSESLLVLFAAMAGLPAFLPRNGKNA